MSIDVITADAPAVDGCPVLKRIKAFVVDQGVLATLEHVFHSRTPPVAVDLTDYGDVLLRVKDVLGVGSNSTCNPIWEIDATKTEDESGTVRAVLPEALVGKSGIYQLSWGLKNTSGDLVAVNDGLLSIERGLFALDDNTLYEDLGPPTLNEIRVSYMDSDAAENLLLDRIEFSDAQVIQAIQAPVQLWNETPPPLRPTYTTRTFPYRYHWLHAIHGHLLRSAAHNYRRNQHKYVAGGGTEDDQNKEGEYTRAGEFLLKEYKDWMRLKKYSINLSLVVGRVESPYGRRW